MALSTAVAHAGGGGGGRAGTPSVISSCQSSTANDNKMCKHTFSFISHFLHAGQVKVHPSDKRGCS